MRVGEKGRAGCLLILVCALVPHRRSCRSYSFASSSDSPPAGAAAGREGAGADEAGTSEVTSDVVFLFFLGRGGMVSSALPSSWARSLSTSCCLLPLRRSFLLLSKTLS